MSAIAAPFASSLRADGAHSSAPSLDWTEVDEGREAIVPERDGYIPGVPCWIDTNQPDPEAALPFYRGLFGWALEDAMPEGSGGHYFMGRIRGRDAAAISSLPDGAPPVAAWNTYVCVANADDTASKARDAGGAVVMEPFDVMDSGRMAILSDPEGAVFSVWQPNQHQGAGVVNEHGSLIFNRLATRDPDRAKAFYGAVFSWDTLALPAGLMWTLPGYGDHLEERSPGLRDQMKQMGAPDGFIDVVAAIVPIAANVADEEESSRWIVAFAVDDVAATAAHAAELGGAVVSAPTDVPWARDAVIRDPQGASFVTSQFVAENAGLEA
jgi:predicted enzyme related to lactoylglutathione lyase